MNILVVDDEPTARDVVRAYLEKEGYRVFTTDSGVEALLYFRNEVLDFVILDLMLPDVSGEDICREIRKTSMIPIIMLTAKSEETDRLIGLDLGADDYLIKPFSPRELVARIRTILRRVKPLSIQKELFYEPGLTIIPEEHRVFCHKEEVVLTKQELTLLLLMAENPGIVFTRAKMLDRAFDMAFEGDERTVDVHIKNLRRKIEPEPRKPIYIETVYGVGYRFRKLDS
ncbi:response regulator transcription factor [Entomospira nematocerorum]|uniref:Phosphate regulon transcriptional regulatory protein PhoB n=1 Tax=Entomospira nematocerorum TaxID=2719987 RepID=A0A968KSX9_9SPIO|nr:response regulator transcription factor [Entomospira nematocera]NIZ46861.1 response regulator transcription factor [Entomospira nematocera]WDI33340.1 response regulator transcription factor [Entomospira nematocera]